MSASTRMNYLVRISPDSSCNYNVGGSPANAAFMQKLSRTQAWMLLLAACRCTRVGVVYLSSRMKGFNTVGIQSLCANPALFCLLFRVRAFLLHLSSRDHLQSSMKRDTATKHLTRLAIQHTNHLLSTDTGPVSITIWILSRRHHCWHENIRRDP